MAKKLIRISILWPIPVVIAKTVETVRISDSREKIAAAKAKCPSNRIAGCEG